MEADFDSGERGLNVFPFYSARTYNFPVIADHHPALQYFHSGKEIPRIPIKTPRASQLSKEDLIEKNAALAEYLESKQTNIDSCFKDKSPSYLLGALSGGTRVCFKDQFRATSPAPKEEGPFLRFCKRRVGDPDYPQLIRTRSEDGDLLKRKLINEISRSGRRAHLAKIRPCKTSAPSTYLV